MAGVFDYKRYINIFATAQDVKQTFPKDQYTLNWDFGGLGADGWTCDIDWMPLLVDKIETKNNEPDFTNSQIIGFFPGSTTSTVQVGTTISLPANMYQGPMYPGQDINVPITAVNVNWYKGSVNYQRQLLLIQNWEPGVAIGNPENDPDYTPIVESFPLTVYWEINTTTAFTATTITVSATATSTLSVSIANTVSTVLTQPKFGDIPNAVLTTTNFIDGAFTATFLINNEWVEKQPLPTSNYSILTSTITTSSYTITANINRVHPIRLEWRLDKNTLLRGGKTTNKTITVSTSRTVTYFGQPIDISLTQNATNIKIGQTSTFTISHTANETDAITGVVELKGTVFYANAAGPVPVSIGTGTFNANKQLVFNSILSTGTYTLQAFYAGNIGVDIFRTMYIATVSNSVTHLVQFGKEFALTEMLIQEGPNYDYLYAHAIDDGYSENEIGGLVEFFHNGNSLGTSTFVRHTYSFPSTTTTAYLTNLAEKNFTHIGFNNSYPFISDPFDVNSLYFAKYPQPPIATSNAGSVNNQNGLVGKDAAYVLGMYQIPNPTYPNFMANLRYNSTDFDWPPTQTKINTIGLICTEGDFKPTTPTEISITEAIYGAPGSGQAFTIIGYFTATIVLEEFLDTISIPGYPAQTQQIKSQYDWRTNSQISVSEFSLGYSSNAPYVVQTVTGATSQQGNYWPGYDINRYRTYNLGKYTLPLPWYLPLSSFSWTQTPRASGQKYFVQNKNANATTGAGPTLYSNQWLQGGDMADMGDVWPTAITGPARQAYSNAAIYRFSVKYTESLTNQIVNSEIPPPSYVETDSTSPYYGQKRWEGGSESSNRAFGLVWSWLVGKRSNQNFKLLCEIDTPITYVGAGSPIFKSRSHLATLQLPLGTVPTTGTFTATFAGTLQQGTEGYFSTGIPFTDYSSSTVSVNWMYGGEEYANPYDPVNLQLNLNRTGSNYTKKDIMNSWSSDYTKLSATYYPTISKQTTSWMNQQSAAGNLVPLQEVKQGFTIEWPLIEVYSMATGTVYSNVLKPIIRSSPQGLSYNYVKRLGWLSRRTPKGNVAIRVLDPNNTATVIKSLVSYPLTKQETTSTLNPVETITLNVTTNIKQFITVDPQANIPAPLRYSSHPWRAIAVNGNPYLSGDIAAPDNTKTINNYSRLNLLNTSSYTATSTATVIYPLRLDYIPNVAGVNSSTQLNRVISSNNVIPLRLALNFNPGNTVPFSYEPSKVWPNTEEKFLIYSGVLTLPWSNAGTTYWSRRLWIGQLATIRASIGANSVTGAYAWYVTYKFERWSTDGNTLLGSTFSDPYLTFQKEYYWEPGYPYPEIASTTFGYANVDFASANDARNIWKRYSSGGSPSNIAPDYDDKNETGTAPPSSGPAPATQPFLYKVYMILQPSFVGGPPRGIFPTDLYPYTWTYPTCQFGQNPTTGVCYRPKDIPAYAAGWTLLTQTNAAANPGQYLRINADKSGRTIGALTPQTNAPKFYGDWTITNESLDLRTWDPNLPGLPNAKWVIILQKNTPNI